MTTRNEARVWSRERVKAFGFYLPHVSEVASLPVAEIEDVAQKAVQEIQKQERLAHMLRFGGAHVLLGDQNFAKLPVLLEESGEVARELNEAIVTGRLDEAKLFDELVQTAAVCLAWATALQLKNEGTAVG